MVGHSEENAFGGYNYYDDNNHMVNHSEENIFGGHNTYDDNNHMYDSTHSSFDNGADHFNDSNSFTGHATFNDNGGSFTNLEGQHISWHDNIFGGINVDPLNNVDNIAFPHLI